jgi:radical SAM superfamily enzyme YgiQ (UPF0313 family)
VLLFPNTYELGMSSLAVQTLFALANNAGLTCERAFLPAGPLSDVRSLESDTPLAGFDFVLVTTSYEVDWLVLPAMLQAGGLPARRAERDEQYPLVIAGGPAVTCNPRPLSVVADVLVMGEVEPIAPELLGILNAAETREEVLERLATLPGVLLPGVSALPVKRLAAQGLDEHLTETVLLTPDTEFSNRFLIELSRGCGRSCDFCLARCLYAPFRVRRLETILRRVGQALEHTDRVGLVAAAVSDYPWVDDLATELRALGARLSVSSVRAESVSPALLRALAESGQDTLTLAPEAGTESLRRSIGKGMTDADLFAAAERARDAGLSRLKLYFMVGLPGEAKADVEAIPDLVARLRVAVPRMMVSAALGPFSPRPHTPLEREAMLPAGEIERRLRAATAQLRKAGVHDVHSGPVRWAEVQTVLSRGDEAVGEALVAGSLAGATPSALRQALRDAGLRWQDFLGALEYPPGEAPWDAVACG